METEIGGITHFFPKINVAVLEVKKESLSVGDTIHIKGSHTDLTQKVQSMQI